MSRVRVMHVVDTLRIGGTERVAVNLASLLPRNRYETYLATTREEGPLARLVSPHVGRLALVRRGKLGILALQSFVEFVRQRDIRILHAHGSALFFARLASMFPPFPKVVWHDHYGRYAFNDRPVALYRLATRGIAGVIAVNRSLEKWSRESLRVPADRVWYIPNLVQVGSWTDLASELPGTAGHRIVCVANIRPQKDHFNLLAAMRLLKQENPRAHLLLVGDYADKQYCEAVLRRIDELGLAKEVTYLGARSDVPALLRACDVGVLGSQSEGLPLALLEYGVAHLPAVATAVGQCPEVLANGAAGVLVPPSSPEALAEALRELLDSPRKREELAANLKTRLESQYSPATVIRRVCEVYSSVLNDQTPDRDEDLAAVDFGEAHR